MVRQRKQKRAGRKMVKRSTKMINRALKPFPQRFITNMKYSETFVLSPALNNGLFYFNLNSIFDPNQSGVGHQPYGHDTMASLYNRYRVLSASWALNFYSGGSVVRVACIPVNEQWSTTPSLSEVCENPRSRWGIQIPGGNTKQIKGSISLPSLVGRSKVEYTADDRYQATYGSTPTERAYLAILGADIGDLGATISCTITLNYKVESFDIKHLPQS